MAAPESVSTHPTQAEIPAAESGVIVWHRRGLRTADHPALAAASEIGDRVLPVFVFDPAFYGDDGLACDARLELLHESVASLRRLYQAVGATLSYAHGDTLSVLSALSDAGWDVVATRTRPRGTASGATTEPRPTAT